MAYHPKIEARFNFSFWDLSGRAYVLQSGFEVYDRDLVTAAANLKEFAGNLRFTRTRLRENLPFYTLAVIGGSLQRERKVDLYAFTGDDHPGKDAHISYFGSIDGLLATGEAANEEGIIILGQEAAHRRIVTPEIFIAQPPEIPGLRKERDFAGDPALEHAFAMKLLERDV